MPVYAYRCTVCDHAFDQQQSFTDDALTVCPQCSGRLRKVFSPVGVVFKGSGFYRTDARAGGRSSASVPASSPSSDSSSSSSSTAKDAGSTGSSSTGGATTAGGSSGTAAPAASTTTAKAASA